MNHVLRRACAFALAASGCLTVQGAETAPVCPVDNAVQFCEVENRTPPTGVAQLIYAPAYNLLVLKNAQSAIATIALDSNSTTLHFSESDFTDMHITPSGRYVFAADYGGENIGYGTPYSTNYVHRLDLSTLTWDDPKTAYIAGQVQPVSDDQVILKSLDQWVTFTNDAWGAGPALTVLNASTNSFFAPGYYAVVYEGDFRYVPSSGRLIHGNSGDSSQELTAFRLAANNFVEQEGSGVYGSAYGFGGTLALASDESAIYYGALKADPLDVSHNLQVFPEMIYAATGKIAFGQDAYYDAVTAQKLGTLNIPATVYAIDPDGEDFWIFDAGQNLLRHYRKNDRIFSGDMEIVVD